MGFHTEILDLAKKLGYFASNDDGCCHGFSVRWLEANLTHEEERFYGRITKIGTYYKNRDEFIKKIKTLKAKKGQPLSEEDYSILDILAFYESLTLYQNPSHHTSLFNQGMSQKHIEDISLFASSDSLRNKGRLASIYNEPAIYKQDEIKKYFDEIAAILNQFLQKEERAGFILSSLDHAIALTYQPGTGWVFMDINQYPPEKFATNDTASLARTIALGLSTNPYDFIPLNVSLFTTHGTHQKSALQQKLADFKKIHLANDHFKKLAKRCNKEGFDLAYIAAKNGDTEVIDKLGKEQINLDKIYGDSKTTLAHLAAQNGHCEIINLLAQYQVDVNKANLKSTPIHAAALNNHCDILQALCKHGGNPNAPNEWRASPVHWAASRGNAEAIDKLKELGADLTCVDKKQLTIAHYAILSGNPSLVAKLLNEGIDFCKPDRDGIAPLHYAAFQGYGALINLFKKRGFDLTIGDSKGLTIAHYLAAYGHVDLIAELIDEGVDFNKKDNSGMTPVHMAGLKGQLGVIQLFAERGFDLAVEDNFGENIVHKAALNGHACLVPELVKRGINLNHQDKLGLTPVFFAAYHGHLAVIKELIKLNANFNMAVSLPENTLRKLINKLGLSQEALARADDFLTRKQGKNPLSITPYDIALIGGHTEVLRFLSQQEERNKKLLDSIQVLRQYGKKLQQGNRKSIIEGVKAVTAADTMEYQANLFFAELNSPDKDTEIIKTLQQQFKKTFDQCHHDLKSHRALWKPILANIAIAATGVGLLIIIGKLLATGSAFFSETSRQRKLNTVLNEFNQLAKNTS